MFGTITKKITFFFNYLIRNTYRKRIYKLILCTKHLILWKKNNRYLPYLRFRHWITSLMSCYFVFGLFWKHIKQVSWNFLGPQILCKHTIYFKKVYKLTFFDNIIKSMAIILCTLITNRLQPSHNRELRLWYPKHYPFSAFAIE